MNTTEPAPRISWFEGRSIKVFQEADFIGFRAAKGHALTSPKRVGTLYLRDGAIFSVAVVALDSPDWVSLHIHGDFREGDLPDDITLAPVAADDAVAVARQLTEQLKLPRRPEAIYPYRLTEQGPSQLDSGAYIRVVGCYRPSGHFEGPNFEGVQLQGDRTQLQGLIPGRRYAVTGYYGPAAVLDGTPRAGWIGPSIYVRSIQPEPAGPRLSPLPRYEPPPSPFRRGPLWACLHPAEYRGHEQLEFSTLLDPETRIIAALDGQGGDRTGHWAARAGLLTLATLIPEPFYQPFLAARAEPTPEPRDDFAAWVAWLLDRSPLPSEPAALLSALGLRIGHVLEELNLRGYSLGLGGVLALVQDRRVTLLRRGMARAYLLRNGQLQVLLYEDTLARHPGFLASPEAQAAVKDAGSTPLSLFTPQDVASAAPPLTVDVQPGDRLIVALGRELLDALSEPAREHLLAAADPRVVASMPATQDMDLGGWGVLAIDFQRVMADPA